MRDPRPHVGEPLALDLLNTRWASADGPQDLLSDTAGLRCWLQTNDLADRCAADGPTLDALILTREAILQAVSGGSADDVNEVLDHGRIRRRLADSGPRDEPDVPEPRWLPGWLAADNLLQLLSESPRRIKQCAHPHCILWFHDTSKNGTRRWHSMTTCGNRAKAARHYAARRE
ncbi:CGNR zinc finger domain-containing protein [Mycolicibacterium fluoranthenivorans]|uniref:Putative RNA-binding Zn ribbon-like protein n=1 Tax=Mycolicibacterium fluoranthenivorans TaxID=258505 RepID=A0A7X5ZE25_9MYCO|nr:CGNR zinc finger domain-containing protein [Mycolicibacterium fluoranthenivorans]MCV7354758.1 CGNR zinc finger domain-containing protein [Mycolicibacterium fluoranthenivorans]NIH96658.1 putative RNA-binding Zn ribbon-like protein [Mycolicibacterium fluoranthenivorans]